MTAEGISVSNAGSQPRKRINELAPQRRRFGCRRLHILLRRAGVEVNRKKLYRLYCEALSDLCGVADAAAGATVATRVGVMSSALMVLLPLRGSFKMLERPN
jgi:hypothetical protein